MDNVIDWPLARIVLEPHRRTYRKTIRGRAHSFTRGDLGSFEWNSSLFLTSHFGLATLPDSGCELDLTLISPARGVAGGDVAM